MVITVGDTIEIDGEIFTVSAIYLSLVKATDSVVFLTNASETVRQPMRYFDLVDAKKRMLTVEQT